MKTLALFDFDGTLYKKDSLIEFTKFYKGKFPFYLGIIILTPILVAMKLKVISNEKAKKKFISYFFKNENYLDFKTKATKFSLTKIEPNLNSKIHSEFKNHIHFKNTIYIVTASFPEWIEPWSNNYNVEVIGTRLEVIDNKITGNLFTKNCYGKEKVNRIKQIINPKDFDKIYCYGSGKGDYEMLNLSKKE